MLCNSFQEILYSTFHTQMGPSDCNLHSTLHTVLILHNHILKIVFGVGVLRTFLNLAQVSLDMRRAEPFEGGRCGRHHHLPLCKQDLSRKFRGHAWHLLSAGGMLMVVCPLWFVHNGRHLRRDFMIAHNLGTAAHFLPSFLAHVVSERDQTGFLVGARCQYCAN